MIYVYPQDINIASNVSRVLAARDVSQPQRPIHVTALMASRGLLWVGTNVGIALTVPLPRLEGVPIISGRANISYHAHFGPVTFFLNLQHKVVTETPQLDQEQSPSTQQQTCINNQSIKEEPEDHSLAEETSEELSPGSPISGPSSVPPCLPTAVANIGFKPNLRKQYSDGSLKNSPCGSLDKVKEQKLK